MASETKSKSDLINERQNNLPLPEQPPTASDFNSADERTVNVGSGAVESSISTGGDSGLREPASGESSVRADGNELKMHTAPSSGVGRQGKDNLDTVPKDAVTRDAKKKV